MPQRRLRRVKQPRYLLAADPGRVGQALKIDRSLNGLALVAPPCELVNTADPHEVVVGVRVGITKAAEQPWRFGLVGSRFVSRRFG